MSKKREKLDAFIAYTKKIFVKQNKDIAVPGQLSLFEEGKDSEKERKEIYLPYYMWVDRTKKRR